MLNKDCLYSLVPGPSNPHSFFRSHLTKKAYFSAAAKKKAVREGLGTRLDCYGTASVLVLVTTPLQLSDVEVVGHELNCSAVTMVMVHLSLSQGL